MRRYFILLISVVAFTGVACPPAPREDIKKKDDGPAKKLTVPENLRPRVELALQLVRERDLRADHGFWTVFHAILGTGLNDTNLLHPKTRERVNAIDFVREGNAIPGLTFMPTKWGLDVETVDPRFNPRKQFIAQGHRDQFIAEMTQWGMTPERTFKVGGRDYTFQDFIKHSLKTASLTKQQELSWTIVVVSQFYGAKHTWKNEDDVDLRFEQIVEYELGQPIEKAACGGTHRLFGLTWAYHVHLNRGGKKDGVWQKVESKIGDYKRTARKLQKPSGAFSLQYFEPEDARDLPPEEERAELQVSTSGHIVEWLALALSDEELRSPWMQSAVSDLAFAVIHMSDKFIDGGSLYHAAHGLHLYHERVFGTPARYLALPPR